MAPAYSNAPPSAAATVRPGARFVGLIRRFSNPNFPVLPPPATFGLIEGNNAFAAVSPPFPTPHESQHPALALAAAALAAAAQSRPVALAAATKTAPTAAPAADTSPN